MTIFVAHAPADQKLAEGVEKFLERRGQFTELDDGHTAMAPITGHDVLALLLSKDFVSAPTRLRLEQRALDAWAEGRLIVVKLDHGIPPVGLRDLPALDASVEAQREFTWNELANQIREKLGVPRPEDEGDGGPSAPQTQVTARKSSGALIPILLLLPGIAALALTSSIWLVNRIGPTPGSLDDLLNGINAFGQRVGLPGGVMAPICGAAILLMGMSFALIVARLVTPSARKAKREAARAVPRPAAAPPPPTNTVFVSYAPRQRKAGAAGD